MKKAIFSFVILATILGCNKISNQEKAKKLITQAINENLPNKESYIPISLDTLMVANMPFEKTFNYSLQKGNIENVEQRVLDLEPNIKYYEQQSLFDNDNYKELLSQKKQAISRLELEISRFEMYKKEHGSPEGFMMNHKYSFFNLDKGRRDTVNCLFFFDPTLNHLYATASFDQENEIYDFRFTSTHAK